MFQCAEGQELNPQKVLLMEPSERSDQTCHQQFFSLSRVLKKDGTLGQDFKASFNAINLLMKTITSKDIQNILTTTTIV
jgi:hypothetical protein